MNNFYNSIRCRAVLSCLKIKNSFDDLKKDKRGMGTIEVVLIVAILVALALVFRTFINKYANGIFDNIEEKTSDAFENW